MRPEKEIVLPGLWVESTLAPKNAPFILYLLDLGKTIRMASLAEDQTTRQVQNNSRLFCVTARTEIVVQNLRANEPNKSETRVYLGLPRSRREP